MTRFFPLKVDSFWNDTGNQIKVLQLFPLAEMAGKQESLARKRVTCALQISTINHATESENAVSQNYITPCQILHSLALNLSY